MHDDGQTPNPSGQDFSISIIGLGAVSSAHLSAYEALSQVRIKSVCDVDSTRSDAVAKRYGAKAFSDYQDLLQDGGLDLAVVLTPASTHREIVEAAAASGMHVLCEKPLAGSAEDGRAMVDACRRASVKLFYGASYRFLPALIKAREIISSGGIGDVLLLREELIGGAGIDAYTQLSAVHYPHGGPGGAGMGMVDHGVHLIDIFPWLIGSDITHISGQGQISGAAPITEYAFMTFANGASGHLLYHAATFADGLPQEGVFSAGQGWAAFRVRQSARNDYRVGRDAPIGDVARRSIYDFCGLLSACVLCLNFC